MSSSSEITCTLAEIARGDDSAVARLLPQVYEELRRLARQYFRQQDSDHTLQPTALVHEAFLKLVGAENPGATDRAHFFAVAATVMRQILIDHARKRSADKRGGGLRRVAIEEAEVSVSVGGVDVLDLNEALEQLAAHDARQSRIVEMRVFGGLTCDQTAEALRVSPKTVEADWYLARAWLRRKLADASKS